MAGHLSSSCPLGMLTTRAPSRSGLRLSDVDATNLDRSWPSVGRSEPTLAEFDRPRTEFDRTLTLSGLVQGRPTHRGVVVHFSVGAPPTSAARCAAHDNGCACDATGGAGGRARVKALRPGGDERCSKGSRPSQETRRNNESPQVSGQGGAAPPWGTKTTSRIIIRILPGLPRPRAPKPRGPTAEKVVGPHSKPHRHDCDRHGHLSNLGCVWGGTQRDFHFCSRLRRRGAAEWGAARPSEQCGVTRAALKSIVSSAFP